MTEPAEPRRGVAASVFVGCSGRAGLPLSKYASMLRAMEVQETFYRIVRNSTLEGWRREVGDSFRFTMKAFQGVSHPRSSPTWRRAGRLPFEADPEEFGLLRLTGATKASWEESIRMASALRAEYVVIQMPPSFGPSKESIEAIASFFSEVPRPEGLGVGLEVRGEGWREAEGELRRALRASGVTHVVDPLAWEPAHVEGAAYFRLHGRLPGYDYQYKGEELRRVAEAAVRHGLAYVFMNNLAMLEDALRLEAILRGEEPRLPSLEERAEAIARSARLPAMVAQLRRRYGYLRVGLGGEPALGELLGGVDESTKVESREELLALLRRAAGR